VTTVPYFELFQWRWKGFIVSSFPIVSTVGAFN